MSSAFLGGWHNGITANAARFTGFYANAVSATETQNDFPLINTVTLKHININIITNGKDGASVFNARENATDVPNTTLTIAADTTGTVATGEITETLQAASLLNQEHDTTAGTDADSVNMAFVWELQT